VRLRADDRGVTVQIGTVLLFAVLIVLVSTYQATVVPQQNEQVEYNHNQRVHGDLQDLRDELHRTAATGTGGTATVSLGTRYPERALFVNPAPPSGRLATTSAAAVAVRNAEATGETADYWDGTERAFSTKELTYEPRYSVYQDPPTTVYRNGVLYNRFADATVTLAGQQLVEGNRISLVALGGTLSESTNGDASVNVQPVSAATRTVTVRNQPDEDVTVVVPTDLSAGEWEELLAGELDEAGDDPDSYVSAVESVDGEDAVRIVFEPGTYELRTARVGVGSDVSDTAPTYAVDVVGDGATVREDGTQRVVVEVRDEYNNPVSGIDVTVTTAPSKGVVYDAVSGDESDQTVTTDGDGRAAFVYEPTADVSGTEADSFELGFDGPDGDEAAGSTDAEAAAFEVEMYGSDGSGQAYQVGWLETASDADNGDALTCDGETCNWDASVSETVSLTAGTDPIADNAEVRFATSNTSIASISGSDVDTTGPDGNATVTLRAESDGNVLAYASSGGSGDDLTIEISNSGNGDGGQAEIVEIEAQGSTAGQSGKVTFTLANSGTKDATIVGIAINNTTTPAERVSDGDILTVEESQVVFDPILIDNSESSGTRVSVDSVELVSGQSKDFEFNKFRDPDATGSPNVDMDGSTIYVTLFFGDGSQTTLVLNVQ